MRSSDLKVPVGTSTQLGIGLTVAGVATAIVAFATGDRTEQTIGTLTGAAVALLAFAITAAIRAVQAKALIVAHAPLVGTQTQSTPLQDVATEVASAVRERLDEILSVERWNESAEPEPAPVTLGRAINAGAAGDTIEVDLAVGRVDGHEDDAEDGDVLAGPEVEQMEVTAPDLVPPDEGDQAAHDDPAVVSA